MVVAVDDVALTSLYPPAAVAAVGDGDYRGCRSAAVLPFAASYSVPLPLIRLLRDADVQKALLFVGLKAGFLPVAANILLEMPMKTMTSTQQQTDDFPSLRPKQFLCV